MPKGVPLPCMMDNEIVSMFYHCLANVDKNHIEFDKVAIAVGEPSAAKAKERLQRMMKAQEKGVTGKATGGNAKGNAVRGQKPKAATGGTKKGRGKRKPDLVEDLTTMDDTDNENDLKVKKAESDSGEVDGNTAKRVKLESNGNEGDVDGGDGSDGIETEFA